jgi:competence protein ComEA
MCNELRSRTGATPIGTLALVLFGALAGVSAQAQALPDGPGKDTLGSVCSTCHGIDIITSQKRSKVAWKGTVSEMKSKGAIATDQEFEVLVEYLSKNFGQEDAAPASAAPAVMVEGPGKAVILRVCTTCHQPDHFTKYHHTPDEWQVILARMGARANASKEDMDTILAYMNTNYPKVEDKTKVNVNKASAQDLQSRLDLTTKEAEAIVNYRSQYGDFRDWGEMLVIMGVDGRKLETVKDRMSF